MEWMTAIRESIRYMEENILTVSGPAETAAHVNMSEMYLQRGFQMVTGLTLGEYVRNRRLYLAAMDLVGTKDRIIDISLRYGYETPESFTKAFRRFHDASPTQIRKLEKGPSTFLPMRVTMEIKGGPEYEVRIEKHDAFRLIGMTWDMPFEEHLKKVPKIMDDFEKKNKEMLRGGAKPQNPDSFTNALYENRIGDYDAFTGKNAKEGWCRFMIAGMYTGGKLCEGMEIWDVPASEWAKFSCEGPLNTASRDIKKYIWYEWLPGNREYELSGDYYVTKQYRDKDTAAQDYQCELWMPVRKRS